MPTQAFSVMFLGALISSSMVMPIAMADTQSSYVTSSDAARPGLQGALQWLVTNESSGGFFGPGLYDEHWTAAAGYALWLNDSHSTPAAKSYSWLALQLNDSSHWFWGKYGEADVAGVSLYSLVASGNLHLVQFSTVESNLLQLKQSSGGFLGYTGTGTNTSSVDTAEALLGLINAGAISASSKQSAVEYLFTLQLPDGSFSLTSGRQYDNLYSLGPEPVSITALVLLALKDASYTSSDSHVSKALNFLNTVASKRFTVLANDTNPVYSASLSALAFNSYGRSADASTATAFILSHQNSDGGFRDTTRGSTGSNALDTAWAAIALEEVHLEPFFAAFLRPLVLMLVVVGIVALVVIVSLVIFLVLRSRKQVERKPL